MNKCYILSARDSHLKKIISLVIVLASVFSLTVITSLDGSCADTMQLSVNPGGMFAVFITLDEDIDEYATLFMTNNSTISSFKLYPLENNPSFSSTKSIDSNTYSLSVRYHEPVRKVVMIVFTVSKNAWVGDTIRLKFYNGQAKHQGNPVAVDDFECVVSVIEEKTSITLLNSLLFQGYASEEDYLSGNDPIFTDAFERFLPGIESLNLTVPEECTYYALSGKTIDSNAIAPISSGEIKPGNNDLRFIISSPDGKETVYSVSVFHPGKIPESSSADSSEESVVSDEDSSDSGSEETSIVTVSTLPNTSQSPLFPSTPAEKENNWMLILIVIGSIGIAALIGLMVRMFLVVRKKQTKI